MTGNITHLSILTLNVNSLNDPVKRHRITSWVKKQDPIICCLEETHLTEKKMNTGLESNGGKRFSYNMDPKQAGIAILMSDKVDFRLKISQKR
jgi:exonuclease III